MANIFNADNGAISGSAGIKLSSDTSGVLNIQTNGTTAISISSSQVVSFPSTTSIGTLYFAAGTAAAPSISVTGDTNTGIYFPAADTIAFTEGGVESMRIDASGNLGVGTASPTAKLHVWQTGAATSLNIDGTENPIFASRYAANADGATVFLAKSRNATVGSHTIVQNGDELGVIKARGSNGTSFVDSAAIYFNVDGTPGSGSDMPGRIVFGTAADGTASISERARIDSSGRLLIAATTAYSTAKLQLGNGDTNTGSGALAQITLQYNSGGGYSHYLTSRHDSVTSSDGNAVLLYLNNSGTSGGSSAPGTGNVLSYFAGTQTHILYTANTERIRVTNNGGIRLGTNQSTSSSFVVAGTWPNNTVAVFGADGTASAISIAASGTATFKMSKGDNAWGLLFLSDYNSGASALMIVGYSNNSTLVSGYGGVFVAGAPSGGQLGVTFSNSGSTVTLTNGTASRIVKVMVIQPYVEL